MNNMDDKNLARLVRKGLISHVEIKLVEELYHKRLREIETKKGLVEILGRQNFVMPDFLHGEGMPSDGIFAIYYDKKGRSTTLFSHNYSDQQFRNLDQVVDSTSKQLSKNVLEKRFVLTEDNADTYPMNFFMLTSILLASSVFGADAIIQKFSDNHMLDYNGLIRQLSSNFQSNDNFSYVLIAGASSFLFSLFSVGLEAPYVTKPVTKLARVLDNKRTQGAAASFLYGYAANKFLQKEGFTLKDETRKITLYQHFIQAGHKIPKEMFLDLYHGIKKDDTATKVEENALLCMKQYKIPLDVAVNILI